MIVKKSLPLFLVLFAVIFSVSGQESKPKESKKLGRPNIPGTISLEFGFNQPFNKPQNFSLSFWGSRTLNIYYQGDFRIAKSKFSVHPGIGFGLERYKFSNYYVLDYDANGVLTMVRPADTQFPAIKKSQLIANYIDVPLEFRFSSNPDDPTRSFKASIGGRFGVLFDSFTKVKYAENGETKKLKDHQNFQLNHIRYGVYAKVGFGNFSIFAHYNISPLFQPGKGPVDASNNTIQTNNFTVGIALASF